MAQSDQDTNYDALVDYLRDVYVALSGIALKRELTETELLILHKGCGLLTEFTDGAKQ